jgi:hypothetical protein
MLRRSLAATSVALVTLVSGDALAVTSSRSVPSAFGGNGHNISFDGRLLLVRDSAGWQAQLVRPEATTYLSDGLPDALGPMLSPRVHVFGAPDGTENALAICEPDAAQAPFACDAAGNASAGGPFDCYDFWLVDSDAVTPAAMGGFVLRRRHVTIWVGSPKTADAYVDHWDLGATEALSPTLKGIEPTVTADGKLLVYQGHPDNDGDIDILMYATNASACAAGGWSAPKPISNMHVDWPRRQLCRLLAPERERRARRRDGQVEDARRVRLLQHAVAPGRARLRGCERWCRRQIARVRRRRRSARRCERREPEPGERPHDRPPDPAGGRHRLRRREQLAPAPRQGKHRRPAATRSCSKKTTRSTRA